MFLLSKSILSTAHPLGSGWHKPKASSGPPLVWPPKSHWKFLEEICGSTFAAKGEGARCATAFAIPGQMRVSEAGAEISGDAQR
jgi:hypothetical protein